MAYRVCEKCIHRSVCVLHEDDFMGSAEKNGFCSQFKSSDDYAEVKHGKWLLEEEPDGKPYCFHCSVCDDDFHRIGVTIATNYCPDCGAKMDNGE